MATLPPNIVSTVLARKVNLLDNSDLHVWDCSANGKFTLSSAWECSRKKRGILVLCSFI